MKTQAAWAIALVGSIAFQHPLFAEEKSTELVVIDLRPQIEKDGSGLTPLSGKCNKGVSRVADVASDPLKVDALKAGLSRQLGLAGDGKTLIVLNWSIYYNQSAKSSRPSLDGVGIQGYTIPGKKKEKQQGSKCSRAESAGGWYQAGDVTSSYAPLISEFSGTYGGKPISVRVVHSPHREIDGKFEGGDEDTKQLLDTIDETAGAVAAAIVR